MPKDGFSFGAELRSSVVQEWEEANAKLQARLNTQKTEGRSLLPSPESRPVVIRSVTRVSKEDVRRKKDADADQSPVMTTLILTAAAGLFDDDTAETGTQIGTFWLTVLSYFKPNLYSAAPSQLKRFTETVYENAGVIANALEFALVVGSDLPKSRL